MAEFRPFVFIGIVIAIIGGLLGGGVLSTVDALSGIAVMYLFSGFAAIVILWGFAGVVDEINENTRRTTELMDY